MDDLSTLLGPAGPFARVLPGFAPRAAQQKMAEAVAETLADGNVLVVEAGTGTGKTFAYLVPALLSGRKVIISTGTRHLQDQLFHRDLPLVREALAVPARIALLKGRANYLCLRRLGTALSEGRQRGGRLDELQRVRDWAGRTRSGDVAELPDIAEDSSVWPLVTSTAENCLGAECPDYAQCHVMKARRAAQEADLLVINHHLLFADLALKEEGFGEILPGADVFILDEAHQLPDTATQFFGISLGSRQLQELARDIEVEQIREAPELRALSDQAHRFGKAIADFRLALGLETRRVPWHEVAGRAPIVQALTGLRDAMNELEQHLQAVAERGRGLENCARRTRVLLERLALMTDEQPDNHVHWLETFKHSFSMHLTPLDIAPVFRERMQALPCGWVFTSATLAVGANFDHFVARLGLPDPDTLLLDSPFDFERNALLFLPPDLPDPNSPAYADAVITLARAVVTTSRGRAFLLFTSHRVMQQAAQTLAGAIDYPLLVQGSAPRSQLLERFRELGNAVLLGTSSFWEGVDVRGAALSCVLIDRLPFASPGDPVLQARIEAMNAEGGNAFGRYQLPNAVIALKQGVGRLIRDVNDRGVLVLCDPRLRTKPYGKVFLRSLPPMPQTRDFVDVQSFFAAGDSDDAVARPGRDATAPERPWDNSRT